MESLVVFRDSWRSAVQSDIRQAEQNYTEYMIKRRVTHRSSSTEQMTTIHICTLYSKDCHFCMIKENSYPQIQFHGVDDNNGPNSAFFALVRLFSSY